MKTTMRVVLATWLTILIAPALCAQDAPAVAAPDNPFAKSDLWAVGIHAGFLSGMGLSARYHPIGRFATQLTLGGIKIEKTSTWNVGVEGQFDFDNYGRSRFYGYLGLGVYSWSKDGVEKMNDGGWRVGIGIAYEWAISAKLIFCANGAITYFIGGDVMPLPQLGFYYYFN